MSAKTTANRLPRKASGDGDNRDRLLRLAAEFFRVKGYGSTTTREIAAALGIQKASLYHYMADKESLLFEICEASLKHIQASVEQAVATAPTPAAAVRALIEAHVLVMLSDRDLHATMLVELRSLTGSRRTRIITMRDQYERLVKRVLEDGQAAQFLRSDIDARELTLMLLNLLNWTIFWYRPNGPRTPAQLATEFGSLFLAGAAVGHPVRLAQ